MKVQKKTIVFLFFFGISLLFSVLLDCFKFDYKGFDFFRVVALAVVLSLIALFVYLRSLKPKGLSTLSCFEALFCVVCFVFYVLWALKPLNYAPDEHMRYAVSQFFFENNRLPVNAEAINETWGFSYAHIPTMLCNVANYVAMKFAALFTVNEHLILIAARLTGVFAGTGTVYFTVKSAKLLFSSPVRWVMIILVAAIPQFAFITGYVNNDIFALLGISIILYAWVSAIKENWNYKRCTLLCFGMALCITSYYNSYGWILGSIFLYFVTYLNQNPKNYKQLTKMTIFIVVLTFLLAGYFFIRHLVLYQDLLGFSVTRRFGNLYGDEALKTENRFHPQTAGYSIWGMLIDLDWLKTSAKSFVGCFGYMTYYLPDHTYLYYALFFLICTLGLLLHTICCFFKKNRLSVTQITFYACLITCIIIPIGLSIYNSYSIDYQPQGRYLFPALPAMAVLLTKGADFWLKKLRNPSHVYGSVGFVSAVFIFLIMESYFSVFLTT